MSRFWEYDPTRSEYKQWDELELLIAKKEEEIRPFKEAFLKAEEEYLKVQNELYELESDKEELNGIILALEE